MNPFEFSFGLVVVCALVALALYFGWRQIRVLRGLSGQPELHVLDRAYYQAQAWRRLFCSGLMILLACLLVGSYFMEPEFQQMTDKDKTRIVRKDKPVLMPEEKGFLRRFTYYWIFTLVVLFMFFVLAAWDIRATLRYGLNKHRQLKQEHHAELTEHLQRLRRERNGKQT